MKDFVVKNYGLLFGILVMIIIVIGSFTWTLTQDKKFISEKYVQIATVFFGASVAISALSFYVLHKGSSEKSKLSKEETESIIVDAVDSAFQKTLEEQEKGLGRIQTKVETVNTLLGDAEDAINKLGESTKKIEEVSDFIAYKSSNNELSITVKHDMVPVNKNESIEVTRKKQLQVSEYQVKNVAFELEIPRIGAKYSATEVPYKYIQVIDDLGLANTNSFSLSLSFSLGRLSKELTIKHRLNIQELHQKFDKLKVGDSATITTNVDRIRKSSDYTVVIDTNDGTRFMCKVVDGEYFGGESLLGIFTIEIFEIKQKVNGKWQWKSVKE